jgi:hypothetical protein
MNPRDIREEIARIISLPVEDREHLHRMSITSLILSLLDYTKELERQNERMLDDSTFQQESIKIAIENIRKKIEEKMIENPINISKVDNLWNGLFMAHEVVLKEKEKY